MALEQTIRDELRDMIAVFEREGALGPLNPQLQLMRSVGNVICALVFGQRMGGVDKEFDHAVDAITNDVVATADARSALFLAYGK